MSIGLKRGTVELADYDPEWKNIAATTIEKLWRIFGDVAKDIQHIGSTSIKNIKAKPVIDISVAVDDFSKVERLTQKLESEGVLWGEWRNDERMLFFMISNPGIVTHFIHVVKVDSEEWFNFVNFRDYLNANISVAKEYEELKIKLADENSREPKWEKYTDGKHPFIEQTLADVEIRKKQQRSKNSK